MQQPFADRATFNKNNDNEIVISWIYHMAQTSGMRWISSDYIISNPGVINGESMAFNYETYWDCCYANKGLYTFPIECMYDSDWKNIFVCCKEESY